MVTAAPSTRDVDQVRKDLAAETKRVDGVVERLNGILQSAKNNDDRIENLVKALAARLATGGENPRITQIVARLNESLLSAKKNDDRLEAMIKALEAKVDKLGKR